MKVVALVSGGKDSCFNMMKCVENGHEIIALANLCPREKGEQDSYMYQTVGQEGISLYAEAMELPLYRRFIDGTSKITTFDYSQTEGDEVEDLYHLLSEIKEKENIEAVSVGAIFSGYQKARVENVCDRLGLHMLAYLWEMDQTELLDEMIQKGVDAIIIKVATLGLDESHLGVSLANIQTHLAEMNKKYGLNVCGEGGEYETFTVDCPLFKKKIAINQTRKIVHSADAFAPVAYLQIDDACLVAK